MIPLPKIALYQSTHLLIPKGKANCITALISVTFSSDNEHIYSPICRGRQFQWKSE